MDDEFRSSHSNFAGRSPAGTLLPTTIAKNGNRHVRCSVVFLVERSNRSIFSIDF